MARSLKYLFAFGLPLAAIGLGAAWMMGVVPTSKGGGDVVYETSDVSRGEIRRLVSTSGPVRALVTVSIGSQLSGQVNELKVDFNSEVKEGEILARIDDKTFAARVAQAKADLAAARATLANQEATKQRAMAVMRNAERLMTRQQALATKGVTSAASLDLATRDKEVAIADIAVIEAQIENARAQIAQREAALQAAEIDLERTNIRSPIDGTVISRTIDIGQTVAASLQAPELFKIAQDLRRIRIEAQVNEADVGVIKEGNPAEFTVDAYPEARFTGVVTQVRLAAIELQNVVTYTVIIEAANDDRRLYPGMTANVQIETARRDNILRITNDALRFKPRDAAAAPTRGPAQMQERANRLIEQMTAALKLDEEQIKVVREAMRKAGAEMAAARSAGGAGGPGGGGDAQQQEGGGNRGRFMASIEAALDPVLRADQRPLLERWKKARQSARFARIWVLGADGSAESRSVRLGIADEQFVEVMGRTLKEGDRVIVRARQSNRKG